MRKEICCVAMLLVAMGATDAVAGQIAGPSGVVSEIDGSDSID